MGDDSGQRPKEEAERRRDEVLRRMLNTPPKPHKHHDVGKPEGRPERVTKLRKPAAP